MTRAAIALVLTMLAGHALGRATQPEVPPAIAKLLEGRALTDDQRKDIRIRHGVWTDADLDTPARKARAALIIGDWKNPALNDSGADPLDRTEAAIARGEMDAALTLLELAKETQTPVRAARLRGEALLWKNRQADADAVWATAAATADTLTNADELVEAVRCMAARARLPIDVTKAKAAAGDYKRMLALLAKARTELDRFCWRASLAEAEILVDKDNPGDGEQAAREAGRLCPRSAEAMYAIGILATSSFAFDAAEQMAAALRETLPESPHAAIIAARTRVRQSDAAGAAQALEPALKNYPTAPAVKAIEAAIAVAAFDFAKADTLLAEFDRAFPGSPEAYCLVGRTLSDSRQYAEAAKYLNEAVKRAPAWADPWIELGLMEMQFGRNEQATVALERATDLDPFNVRAANSYKLVLEVARYETVETEHFLVRHKPGLDGIVAKEMREPLEANYRRVTGAEKGGIDFPMPSKTVIELFPDHEWFAVRIAGMPRIHTIAAATGPLIAMEAPRSGPNHLVGPYDWVRVVRHEFVHTVTLARTKNRIPHWFTEAAAVFLEDAPRDWNAIQILSTAYKDDELFDFRKINLAFIRPEKPTDRPQGYAQGHWMYEFMIERFGARAPLDLMDLYAKGVPEPEAFTQVLKVTREEFFTQFRAWAKTQLVAWGMLPPEGMPAFETALTEAGGGAALEEPTPEALAKALEKYPKHPDLLYHAVRASLAASKNAATAEMVPLLERYAAARPVDPLPHKLLTAWYLSGDGVKDPAATDNVIAHLEYLDAREQYSPAFATELANRYGLKKDWDRAWAKALRAVRIAPYDARTRELAATIAILRKDYAEAQWQLEALKAIEPDVPTHDQRLDALKKLRGS